FILNVESAFSANANPEIAAQQAVYMRNQFSFYGLKTPVRRELVKPLMHNAALPAKDNLELIVKTLWRKPQRELQYTAMELAFKYLKYPDRRDLELYEFMVVNKSWWDTVDYVAGTLMGSFFKSYPEMIQPTVDRWLASGNIWLQRSAILFQLKYKADTDVELLSEIIQSLLGSKEFFINKAIGWILREYSKTNPEWVRSFTERT